MRLGPDSAAALRQAVHLHKAGRLDAAIKAYRGLLKRWPDLPQAHNNLGAALKAAGKPRPAAAAYRRAVALAPAYTAAHANLASVLLLLGRPEQALWHFLVAARQEPEQAAHRQGLAAALRPMRFTEASPAIEAAFQACLDDPGIEHQSLVPAALSLLRHDRALADDEALAAHPLVMALLLRAVLPDPDWERRLTVLRRACREAVAEREPLPVPRSFVAALAVQAFLTDHGYPVSDDEEAWVEQAAGAAVETSAGERAISDSLLVVALYRPLYRLPGGDVLADLPAPEDAALAMLLRRQLQEPVGQAALADSLPRLTAIENATSAALAAQYDEHPYPRWFATRAKTPRSLAAVLAALFPGQSVPLPEGVPGDARLEVLVAGCGTGKHAIDVATRYAGAEVLAVDLSRAALAVGAQRARAARVANVTFGQADILALDGLDRRFHLIESVGVLHHLRDPLAGWRVLVDRLAPGGLMRLGFYSRRARTAIAQARDWIAAAGYPASASGIREARQALLALPEDRPERRVAGQLDFYSLSGCRDLLFNVQERSYDLPDLAAALDGLGLGFLGFEFADPAIPRAYAARFPKDRHRTDLANWDRFEAERPDCFQQMYQFWCRKL